MLNQDDKIWLDTIAGKDVPEDANPDTVAEAQALREAIHAEQQLQKLMSRIAETTPQPKEKTFMDKLREWLEPKMMPVLAPLVVVVSVVAIIIPSIIKDQPNNSDFPRHKQIQEAEYSQKIEKKSKNPQQKAEQLKQDFIAAGATVEFTVTTEEQSYQLDIKIPTSASDELRALCDRIGINPEENKSVRIIVNKPE
jgi:hypothetical protein